MDSALAAKRQEYIARVHTLLSSMRFLAAMLDREGESSTWLNCTISLTEDFVAGLVEVAKEHDV